MDIASLVVTALSHLTAVQVLLVFLGMVVLSAIASAMPEPTSTSGVAYRWMYGIAHSISANVPNVLKALKPPMK